MKNIIDYIEEYGERTFSQLEFNEVDALILSQFSYFRWDKVIPGLLENKDGISIDAMIKDVDAAYVYEKELYPEDNKRLLEIMAGSRRFGSIVCNYFSQCTSEEIEMQFAAFTCFPKQAHPIIVFRGTDGTVIGWKEDFNMAFSKPISGQRQAALYVNQVSLRIKGDFLLAGHSKGGNLAAFAAMCAVKGTRERIRDIYSFDGPGFRKEILEEYGYNTIANRIHKFVPKSSIVGMLLDGKKDYITVKSKAVGGILQHNPYSWEVNDNEFERALGINRSSLHVNKSMNQWIMELDEEQLEMFVTTLFDVISASGAKNIPEIMADKKSWLIAVRDASQKLDVSQRENFTEIMKEMFNTIYSIR